MNEALTGLANNVPLLIAVVGILGGVVAAKVIKPPTYKELVDENRSLRKDRDDATGKADAAADAVSNLRDEFESFKHDRANERSRDRKMIGILSDGVEAMWSYVKVLITDMERYGNPVPQPSDYVNRTIARARRARLGEIVDTGELETIQEGP